MLHCQKPIAPMSCFHQYRFYYLLSIMSFPAKSPSHLHSARMRCKPVYPRLYHRNNYSDPRPMLHLSQICLLSNSIPGDDWALFPCLPQQRTLLSCLKSPSAAIYCCQKSNALRLYSQHKSLQSPYSL